MADTVVNSLTQYDHHEYDFLKRGRRDVLMFENFVQFKKTRDRQLPGNYATHTTLPSQSSVTTAHQKERRSVKSPGAAGVLQVPQVWISQ